MKKTYPLAIQYARTYKDTKAITTGEFREPQKGEWYLSGAIAEAYQAPNNLSEKYHIVKLVQDSFIIEGYYGNLYGWEYLIGFNNRKDAEICLQEYRENEKGYSHRLRFERIEVNN